LACSEGNLLKKKLLAVLTTGAFIVSFGGFDHENTAYGQAPPKGALPGQMSESAFKNVTVLKGIPVDEFMGTMGLFAAALSYCCKDCHTGAGTANPKWEDDPPRKVTARRMIQMVKNINQQNFNGRQVVTCWTCHRGSTSPAITPPIDTVYGDTIFTPTDVLPAANAATAGTPPADQILDKYIQALGGADALAKLTSYTAKGTSHLFGEVQEDQAEIFAKAPNLLATVVHQREGDVARTYDGREAWVMLPLTVVGQYPLNASALEGAKLDAQLAFPGGLKQFFTNWRVSYPSVVDGRPVYVIQGTSPNGLVATFYFDKQTGLLTRMVRYAASAVGRVPTQIDYSDYRPVNGVMMSYKWTYGWISGREEYTLTAVQPNVPVDAAKFAKPVQRTK
jgi:photosynthetic reaction center cytochrome c subunit